MKVLAIAPRLAGAAGNRVASTDPQAMHGVAVTSEQVSLWMALFVGGQPRPADGRAA